MARVMTLSGLPVAGAYRQPPGRILGELVLSGMGRSYRGDRDLRGELSRSYRGDRDLRGLGGLGLTTAEMCNDPASALLSTLSAGVAAGLAAQHDQGWQQAGSGVQAATTAFNAACTSARAAAAGQVISSDPAAQSTAAALAQIQALSQQQQSSAMQMQMQQQLSMQHSLIMGLQPAVFYGGLALVGVLGAVGLYFAFRK